MRITNLFLFLIIFISACSPSRKTEASKKAPEPTITKTDIIKGGTSFENAVVIKVSREREGVAEEYKWLSESYPGYSTIRKRQTTQGQKHYDIITIRTRNGERKVIYFDSTSFFGKW